MTDSQAEPELSRSHIEDRPISHRPISNRLVAGAIWGPGLFILAWIVSGLLVEGYSPIDEHISDLAGVDSPTRALMTAGLAAFSIGVATSAWPLRRIIGTPAAVALGLSAICTFVIVLTPSGQSSFSDFVHGGFAVLLYLFLAMAGPLSYPALRPRSLAWSIMSVAAGMLTGAFLVMSLGETNSGLFQRLGLTTTDIWLMVIGVGVVSGRLRGELGGWPR